MDVGSILLILAVFLIAAAFVARPLMQGKSVMVSEEEQSLSSLIAERERILNALSELDFDHEMGKVPEDVYLQQRKQLAQAGVEILRKIDAFQANDIQEAPDALESAIVERKQALAVAADGDDSLEAMIAARRAEQASLQGAGKFCPNCGEGIQTDDKFCSHCGAVLT